jgi:hypothetical protein
MSDRKKIEMFMASLIPPAEWVVYFIFTQFLLVLMQSMIFWNKHHFHRTEALRDSALQVCFP